ncbi:hypothetical protein BST81_15020 [Leptolyngbya sp. 'hensonii']|uniref:tetratricopeptide repeat protein n=1 Tax=Leptolyngbya sp. 'hensonii' TaxID=1922337 RepID=UPI00094F6EE6|nr:tetratricopeptide repeat protein [Leptolyngbya sp. 'hensonii']OLP17633.1 hypothetical protein BST81_15020 [Leptolyngbya sp. 'hensonii']
MLDTGRLALTGIALSLFQQGLSLSAAREYREALKSFDLVLQIRPDCSEVWHERGLALENLGDYREAVVCYDRALQSSGSKKIAHEIWHSRGNALQYGLGNYEAALQSYDQALKLKPNHYLVWQNRGNALLYGLNHFQEAVANYDRVLNLVPDYYLAWRNRGNALLELGHHQAAIASYDQALSLEPNDQVSAYARSNAISQLGLLEKQPTTDPAWYGRGYNGPEDPDAQNGTCYAPDLQEWGETDGKDTLTPIGPIELELLSHTPILLIQDTKGQREVSLKQSLYSIGRDNRSDIYLHSHYASRHHATLIQLLQTGGGYTYRIVDGDLRGKRSTNGVLVNGVKQGIWDLQHQDEIVLGPDVKLIYLAPVDDKDTTN